MLSRDPRHDPLPGDVVLRPTWGPRECGGTKFHVVKVGPHRGYSGGEQVVCYLEHADGSKVSHSTRCYSRAGWSSSNARGALVCVIAGARAE